jgi:VanZ family protein
VAAPSTKWRARRLWWLAAAAWAGLIFWLSSSSDAQGGFWLLELLPYGDKLAHAVAFGALASFVYLASGRFWLALALASAYGVSDEVHQLFVAGRSPDARDWLADTAGAWLALWAVRYLTRLRRRGAEPVQ